MQADQCFNVPDFVGDCCSCIASRVRASIAGVSFEHFHKNSAKLLQVAVFGVGDNGEPKKELRFPSNRLVVTSIDIQEIEVVDEKTREALKQSVKMAIEITTQGQEAGARQVASVREQTARGKLERQQIQDKSLSEVERKKLIEAETACSSISSTGQAKAEARARAEAANIDGDLNVRLARMRAEKSDVMDRVQLEQKQLKTTAELDFTSQKNELEVALQDSTSALESEKFGRVMAAVGRDTVQEIARAGPEMQSKLLGALGLQGYLVTDGTNPINLFNTARGMTAAATAAPKPASSS
jgi:major vault protein